MSRITNRSRPGGALSIAVCTSVSGSTALSTIGTRCSISTGATVSGTVGISACVGTFSTDISICTFRDSWRCICAGTAGTCCSTSIGIFIIGGTSYGSNTVSSSAPMPLVVTVLGLEIPNFVSLEFGHFFELPSANIGTNNFNKDQKYNKLRGIHLWYLSLVVFLFLFVMSYIVQLLYIRTNM